MKNSTKSLGFFARCLFRALTETCLNRTGIGKSNSKQAKGQIPTRDIRKYCPLKSKVKNSLEVALLFLQVQFKKINKSDCSLILRMPSVFKFLIELPFKN